MSNYLPTFSKEYEFEGDLVTVVFRQMKRRDAMALLKHAPKRNEGEKIDPSNFTPEQAAESTQFVEEGSKYLDTYIIKIEGLKDAQGDDIPKENVIDDVYFLELQSKMVADMFSGSFVQGKNSQEGKKLEGPSEN